MLISTPSSPADVDLNRLISAAAEESRFLLYWWADHLIDESQGGFYGEVDAHERPVETAPKSAILNTRLLWFFSAMHLHRRSDLALSLANRAASYIKAHFFDPDHGGVYWMLDYKGRVIDPKKQGYAQAFAIYALSAHFEASGDESSLKCAYELLSDVEDHFWDVDKGGYIEALSAFWLRPKDQRLSPKDVDAPKTMNTHLHILEAYTNLHRIAPRPESEAALRRIVRLFLDRFVGPKGEHLRLFFDMDWTDRTEAVSYGHDIEASWLLWEAAQALGDTLVLNRVRHIALTLAQATLAEGVGDDGGLYYERRFDGHLDPVGEWWGQAEAMVGFLNAYQLSGDQTYLTALDNVWAFVRREHKPGLVSEWTWYPQSADRPTMYRAGLWKCPYHNGRAMMEIETRLKALKTGQ